MRAMDRGRGDYQMDYPGEYPSRDYSGDQDVWDAEQQWSESGSESPEERDGFGRRGGRGGPKGDSGFATKAMVAGLLGIVVLACCVAYALFGLGGGGDDTPRPSAGTQSALRVAPPTTHKVAKISYPIHFPTTTAAVSQASETETVNESYAKSLFDQNANSLNPDVDRNDGSLCMDDEDPEMAGLCYKKCSLLTNGTHPIRTSAVSCCAEHPCGITNQKVSVHICTGFDVAGDQASRDGCPHPPGACLVNEQLLVGLCYKQCSILTDGKYPYRVSPTLCCKKTSTVSCLLPSSILSGTVSSSVSYNVGGGTTDALKKVHQPVPSLTEAGLPTTTPFR